VSEQHLDLLALPSRSTIVRSLELTGEGQAISEEVSENLSEIVSSASKVTDIVTEISQSVEQQASAIEQVSLAMLDMDKIVQQNAATSEQASAAADSLTVQTRALTDLVKRFELNEGSHASDDQTYAPTLRAVGM